VKVFVTVALVSVSVVVELVQMLNKLVVVKVV
jgi:hypothetical protein